MQLKYRTYPKWTCAWRVFRTFLESSSNVQSQGLQMPETWQIKGKAVKQKPPFSEKPCSLVWPIHTPPHVCTYVLNTSNIHPWQHLEVSELYFNVFVYDCRLIQFAKVVSFFTKKWLHLKLTVEVNLKPQGSRVSLEKREGGGRHGGGDEIF